MYVEEFRIVITFVDHFLVDWSDFASSAYQVVHADSGVPQPRRVPQFLARGPYNSWGFDKGLASKMEQRPDNDWELEIMATWPSYVQLNVFGNDDYFYGDTDGDGIMERLPPNSAAPNYLNMSAVSEVDHVLGMSTLTCFCVF